MYSPSPKEGVAIEGGEHTNCILSQLQIARKSEAKAHEMYSPLPPEDVGIVHESTRNVLSCITLRETDHSG